MANGDAIPTLGPVKALLLLCVATAVLVIFARYKTLARRDRTTVIARLAEESPAGVLSPTEELFRSEGIPISDDLRRGLASAPPPPPTSVAASVGSAINRAKSSITSLGSTGTTAAPMAASLDVADAWSSLGVMFAGINLPCGLAPVGTPDELRTDRIDFSTDASQLATLPAALEDALSAIGWDPSWVDESTATLRRGDEVALLRIYDRPELVGDGTSTQGLAGVRPGDVVVRLVAP